MKIDTMRFIDKYAGIPICFIQTLVLKILEPFLSSASRDPNNILLIELSEMGSVILADPAMRKLKAHGKNLHFAIFSRNKGSLDLLNTVDRDNIFTFRQDSLANLAKDTWRFMKWVREKRIGVALDLELFARFTAILTGLTLAPERVGFNAFYNEGLYRGNMLTKNVTYNPHMHISKNYVALANACLSREKEIPFSKTIIDDREIQLARWPRDEVLIQKLTADIQALFPDHDLGGHRLVLMNPNASDLMPLRRWPMENFIRVMRMVVDTYPDVLVVVTGAPDERDKTRSMANEVNSARCKSFAGGCRIHELPALYSLAELMLTNDSGPAHFASVTDMHTIVMFGPETPALYGCLGKLTALTSGLACSPCVSAANHRKSPCTDNKCMKLITPELVMNAMAEILEDRS